MPKQFHINSYFKVLIFTEIQTVTNMVDGYGLNPGLQRLRPDGAESELYF